MENGVWRTIRGHKVFIKDGENISEALARVNWHKSKGEWKMLAGRLIYIKENQFISEAVKESRIFYDARYFIDVPDFMNDRFETEDLEGIDFKTLKINKNALNKLMEDYPIMASIVLRAVSDEYGFMYFQPLSDEKPYIFSININKRYYLKRNNINELMVKLHKERWFTEISLDCVDVSNIIHEYGHCYFYDLILNKLGYSTDDISFQNGIIRVGEALYNIIKANEDFQSFIPRYVKQFDIGERKASIYKFYSELFAESFRNMNCGKINVLGKSLKELLDEEGW